MKVNIGSFTEGDDKQIVEVQIDPWDTWSMDYTLSHIIHPMLLQLKEKKHGSPYVDDLDVPENIRSTNAKPKENDWDIDEFHHQRWEYILDEMIFAFDQIKYDCTVSEERVRNGTILFGKYLQSLWS